MTPLVQQHCAACAGGTPPLSVEQAQALLPQVPGWALADGLLVRTVRCKSFPTAIALVDRVAVLAEAEGHHPDFHIHYARVRLELTTHAIHGLSDNDFILAAKINELL